MTARTVSDIDALIGRLVAHGLGGCNPETDQRRELIRADRPGPLQFLNLLAYRDRAEYPDGHQLADPEYVAGLVHRDAGLSETVVLVTRSLLQPSV